MEALNDDIIIEILRQLSLKDQLTMLHVHVRFNNLMANVWALEYKSVDLSLYEANFSSSEWSYFLRCICKSVQVLRLKMLKAEDFKALTSYIFPKVRDLRFAQSPPQFMCDSDIPKIQDAFPNLEAFSPHGQFSGDNFTGFPHLKRLTLSYCSSKFKVENLERIMNTHQLREIKLGLFDRKVIETSGITLPVEHMSKLEHIKVDLDELAWFEQHFRALTNLKELTVCAARQNYTLWKLCSRLAGAGLRDLEILETCNSTNSLKAVVQLQLHVGALKIVTHNFLLFNLNLISMNALANVRQLFFKSCCVEDRFGFNVLMHNIAQVELISFEQCTFPFEQYEFEVSCLTEHRLKPLTINLYQNICSLTEQPWIGKVIGESKLLTVESRNYDYTFEPIYIKFK